MVLEKTFESPLDCTDIKPVNPKGSQSWLYIGGTDAEAKAPILWPPDVKSWLIGKDPDLRQHWRQVEKGMAENEMVGRHHWLNGHEFELVMVMVKDREAWLAAVHGVAKSRIWLSNWTTTILWNYVEIPEAKKNPPSLLTVTVHSAVFAKAPEFTELPLSQAAWGDHSGEA